MNLKYDINGPKPKQKDGPVVTNYSRCNSACIKLIIEAHKWTLTLPGTLFLSDWHQATSSRQTSSMRALVAMEMPGELPAVAFGDTKSRSATPASSCTGVMARSHAEIRSIRKNMLNNVCRQLLKHNEWKWWNPAGFSLYRRSALVTSQVRVIQKPQHSRKMVNNTLETLRGWICACALECTGHSWVGAGWWKLVFDILLMKSIVPPLKIRRICLENQHLSAGLWE